MVNSNPYEVDVSVVISTYQRTDTLPLALHSLTQQTLSADRYEILVVDNDAAGSAQSVVASIHTEGRVQISYQVEHAQGLSYARNAGIRAARSDLIAFMDDDAEADPNWLTAILRGFARSDDVWATGGKVVPIWDAERPAWLGDDLLRSLSIIDWGEEERALQWPERLIGTNCAFRRVVFQEVGSFDEALGRQGQALLGNEDTEIQERIHRAGKKVLYLPDAVVRHHIAPARLSKQYFYRRAYGTGRSQAIVDRQRRGRRLVVHRMRRYLEQLIPKVREAASSGTAKEAFKRKQVLAYRGGYLRQALVELMRSVLS